MIGKDLSLTAGPNEAAGGNGSLAMHRCGTACKTVLGAAGDPGARSTSKASSSSSHSRADWGRWKVILTLSLAGTANEVTGCTPTGYTRMTIVAQFARSIAPAMLTWYYYKHYYYQLPPPQVPGISKERRGPLGCGQEGGSYGSS
jgi:hypothetical protein